MANKTPLVLYSGIPGQIRAGDGLDIAKLAYGTANQLLGTNAGGTANEWKTLSGTANQITITHAANSITLSTPQDLTAGGITLTNITQITNRSHTSLTDIGSLAHTTLDSYLDQSVKIAASPTHVGLTLSGMSTAGFVKNNASGVLSGGNGVINTVQRGILSINLGSAGTTNVTITAVTMAKTFLTILNNMNYAIRVQLTSTTNIEFYSDAGTGGARLCSWEAIEFA